MKWILLLFTDKNVIKVITCIAKYNNLYVSDIGVSELEILEKECKVNV